MDFDLVRSVAPYFRMKEQSADEIIARVRSVVVQWRDVLGVLRVQRGRLDTAYLESAAADHGVKDPLDKATAQVEAEL